MKRIILSIISIFISSQLIFAQFDVKLNVNNETIKSGDTIYTCQENISFRVLATYDDGTSIINDNISAKFSWDFGDGSGKLKEEKKGSYSVNHEYLAAGAYYIILDVTDAINTTQILNFYWPVKVGVKPNFDGTKADSQDICYYDEVLFTGEVFAKPWTYEPPINVDADMALYDIVSSKLTHRLFDFGQTLENADSLRSICVTMEHMNASTVKIELSCPDGTTVTLKNNQGIDALLGEPKSIYSSTYDGGVGYKYCWTNDPENGKMSDIVSTSGTDDFTVPSGSYTSFGDLKKFEGCPLNGDWTLSVIDTEPANDNSDIGFVFSWELEFSDVITSTMWNFENTYSNADKKWLGDGMLATINANAKMKRYEDDPQFEREISENKSYEYIFKVKDNFQCEHDTTVDVNVTIPVITNSTKENHIAPLEVTYICENTDWASNYTWDFGDDNLGAMKTSINTYFEGGPGEDTKGIEYTVVVVAESIFGCTETDTITIRVKAPSSDMNEDITAFTPNGDGINDYFQVSFLSEDEIEFDRAEDGSKTYKNVFKSFDGRIYSRWGKRVFQWTDGENYKSGWDGKINNSDAASGIYYYRIRAIGKDNKNPDKGEGIHDFKGFFYLIR